MRSLSQTSPKISDLEFDRTSTLNSAPEQSGAFLFVGKDKVTDKEFKDQCGSSPASVAEGAPLPINRSECDQALRVNNERIPPDPKAESVLGTGIRRLKPRCVSSNALTWVVTKQQELKKPGSKGASLATAGCASLYLAMLHGMVGRVHQQVGFELACEQKAPLGKQTITDGINAL